MPTLADLRPRVVERLRSLLIKCKEQHGFTLRRTPEIEFVYGVRWAGEAHHRDNKIRFNVSLLESNPDEFIHDTVAHELAHFIVRQAFPCASHHGECWKEVMRSWLGVNPKRLHAMYARHSKDEIDLSDLT